jgi:hypothetical protein
MKTLINGAFAAFLLVPMGAADAQAQQAHTPTRLAAPGIDRVIVDTQPSVLRFKVEALRFKAIDESGYDWPWSDEIIVVIRIPEQNVLIASKIFDNVDTGETKTIPANQSCILPIAGVSPNSGNVFRGDQGMTWTCSGRGAAGPFSFTVEMFEKDDGFFHDCVFHWPLGCEFSSGPTSGSDDLIGRRTLVFPLEELAAAMPNVGDTFEEGIRLGGPCGNFDGICAAGWPAPTGPEYEFRWRLTRLPDAEPILHE